jgi:hypothetical protein
MSTATALAPASADEAMAMVHAGLAYMATADATAMSAEERARCLREMEQADSVATAARTSVLGAFAARQDYTDDGDYSACSWLMHRTQVTKGAAVDHTGWVKRGAGHPLVLAALAVMAVSKSYAKEICWWTDRLPAESRQAADEILLGAAVADLGLADLAGLAGEMYERSRQDKPDTDPGDGDEDGDGDGPGEDRDRLLDDRSVTVATTFGGAGVMRGELTPECAEFVQAVLDSLSAPVGADDDRSHEQRYHDGRRRCRRGGSGRPGRESPRRRWSPPGRSWRSTGRGAVHDGGRRLGRSLPTRRNLAARRPRRCGGRTDRARPGTGPGTHRPRRRHRTARRDRPRRRSRRRTSSPRRRRPRIPPPGRTPLRRRPGSACAGPRLPRLLRRPLG